MSSLRLGRVRKLKETLVTVQQLDKNMSNLRTWLSRVEAELAEPVAYEVCHAHQIQRNLAEQQVESRAFRLILKVQTALPPRRSGAEPLGCGVRAVMAAHNTAACRGQKMAFIVDDVSRFKAPEQTRRGTKGVEDVCALATLVSW